MKARAGEKPAALKATVGVAFPLVWRRSTSASGCLSIGMERIGDAPIGSVVPRASRFAVMTASCDTISGVRGGGGGERAWSRSPSMSSGNSPPTDDAAAPSGLPSVSAPTDDASPSKFPPDPSGSSTRTNVLLLRSRTR